MSINRFDEPYFAFHSLKLEKQSKLYRLCCVNEKWRSYTSIVKVTYSCDGMINMTVPRQILINSPVEDLVFVGITRKILIK